MNLEVVVAIVVSLLLVWSLLLVVFWLLRPRDVSVRELLGVIPDVLRLLRSLIGDGSVPADVRIVLVGLIAWIVSPIDLIPERIPFVGALDDVAVMVLAIDVFLEGLPDNLLKEKLEELGIPQAELDSDLRRVRRMIPRPIRALIGRVPGFLDRVGGIVAQSRDPIRNARRVNSEV